MDEKARTQVQAMGIGASFRRVIAVVFTVGAVATILQKLSIVTFFLPLASVFGFGPGYSVYGEQLNLLSLVLLAVFAGTYISEVMDENPVFEKMFVVCLIVAGAVLYRVLGRILPFLGIVLIASLIGGGLLYYLEGSRKAAISAIISYLSITLLFGLAVGLTISLSPLPQVVLALMGVGHLASIILPPVDAQWQPARGINERLLTTTIQLVQNKTGIAVGGIVYTGMYVTTSMIIAVTLPLFLRSGMNFTGLKNMVLNGSAVLGIGFLALMLWYWLAYLPRLPFTIARLTGHYDHDREKAAPPRPAGTLLVPVVGWALTRIPGGDLDTHGFVAILDWKPAPMTVYVVLMALFFLYSCLLIPRINRTVGSAVNRVRSSTMRAWYDRIWNGDKELASDSRNLLYSGGCLIGMYFLISPIAAIFVSFIVSLFIIDRLHSKGFSTVRDLYFIIGCLVVILGRFIKMDRTAGETWILALIFLLAYAAIWFQEQSGWTTRFSTSLDKSRSLRNSAD